MSLVQFADTAYYGVLPLLWYVLAVMCHFLISGFLDFSRVFHRLTGRGSYVVPVVPVGHWMKNDLADQTGFHDDECLEMMIDSAKFC